jgi:hypothetical protein
MSVYRRYQKGSDYVGADVGGEGGKLREKNRTDIRRRAGNVSCAIFKIKNTNSSPWWVNLQISCSGDVLI